MDRLLDVQGLQVTYHTQMGALKALYDVNFHVQPGEIVGIVGESGCGKSTIASALLRLLPPNGEITAGRILFQGQDLLKLGAEQLRQRRGRDLAMIFQDPMTSLNPVFDIGTQMVDVQRAHQRGRTQGRGALRRRAIEMLHRVGIPDATERIDHYPHQFSGGMRQRIMIAMALMSEPALLIADEPTSALDVTLEAQILELVKELRHAYETAVLFISHDLGVVAQLCDRVLVMYAGSVVEQGAARSVFERPQHPYTQRLLDAVPSRKQHGERLATIPGRVPSLAALPPGCKFAGRCSYVQAACIEHEPRYLALNGCHVRCHIYDPESRYRAATVSELPSGAGPDLGRPPVRPAALVDSLGSSEAAGQIATGAPEKDLLVKLENVFTYFYDRRNLVQQLLRRSRGALRAVDGIDLAIGRGEVVGLVGESGSGKTTLGKTVLRLVRPTRGRIFYNNHDIAVAGPSELRRLRRQMQMIFQDPYSSLSPRLRVSYLITEPYTIHGIPLNQRRTVSELLEMVGLSDEQASKYPHELSGGQARRVGIARALALEPRLLVADEPTAGLDVSAAASILNLMKDLATRLELTYLIITHNLNLVGYISDRVAVMYLGKLVEIGPTQQVLEHPRHPYTLALLAATAEPESSSATSSEPLWRRQRQQLLLEGEIPSPKNPPPGCRFHTRCPFAQERCALEEPAMEQTTADHVVACHFWREIAQQGGDARDRIMSSP
jgi:peptide/nickel transport system ATP-binding protein